MYFNSVSASKAIFTVTACYCFKSVKVHDKNVYSAAGFRNSKSYKIQNSKVKPFLSSYPCGTLGRMTTSSSTLLVLFLLLDLSAAPSSGMSFWASVAAALGLSVSRNNGARNLNEKEDPYLKSHNSIGYCWGGGFSHFKPCRFTIWPCSW